jgi:hypothetical protein
MLENFKAFFLSDLTINAYFRNSVNIYLNFKFQKLFDFAQSDKSLSSFLCDCFVPRNDKIG